MYARQLNVAYYKRASVPRQKILQFHWRLYKFKFQVFVRLDRSTSIRRQAAQKLKRFFPHTRHPLLRVAQPQTIISSISIRTLAVAVWVSVYVCEWVCVWVSLYVFRCGERDCRIATFVRFHLLHLVWHVAKSHLKCIYRLSQQDAMLATITKYTRKSR